MTIKHAIYYISLFTFTLPLFIEQSFASGLITVGSDWAQEGGTVNINANISFQVDLEANRSYACTAIGALSDSEIGLDAQVFDPNSDNITAIECGDAAPLAAAPSGDSSQADNRICITPTATGAHFIRIGSYKSGGEDVRIECVETTIFGVYNTNVNDFNFLELVNLTNKTVNGNWRAINFDGATFTGAFTIAPNRRADIDLHSNVGAGRFGHVIVTHDAPRGALFGFVSQYSGSVTDFSLSVSNPLKERKQTQ